MGRRANPSLELSATVRRWFSLSQRELGRALGVSQGLVTKVEQGTRTLPRPADDRLRALALLGPGLADPTFAPVPPLPPAQAPPEAVAPPEAPGQLTDNERLRVQRRLARLEGEAYRLRVKQAVQVPQRTQLAMRWAAALPALQAAAAADPAPAGVPASAAVWLAAHAARLADPAPVHTPHSPLSRAEQGLRLHVLSVQILQLRAWLNGADAPEPTPPDPSG